MAMADRLELLELGDDVLYFDEPCPPRVAAQIGDQILHSVLAVRGREGWSAPWTRRPRRRTSPSRRVDPVHEILLKHHGGHDAGYNPNEHLHVQPSA